MLKRCTFGRRSHGGEATRPFCRLDRRGCVAAALSSSATQRAAKQHLHVPFRCRRIARVRHRTRAASVVVLPALSAFMLAGNKVLHKMAMVPMQPYVLYFTFVQTALYVLIYGAVLQAKVMREEVTPEMLAVGAEHKASLVCIGLFDAVYLVALFAAVTNLPGTVLPLLAQAMLLWNFVLSATVLGKRFNAVQLSGALCVASGAVIAAGGSKVVGVPIPIGYTALYVASMLFMAMGSILRERIFRRGRERLGKPLSVFIVNTFGSLCQFLWMLALGPLLMMQRGIEFAHLPEYLARGTSLLCGQGAAGSSAVEACIPGIYLLWNVAFNVVCILSLRSVGAATMTLAMTAAVPLAIWAFTLTWPLLGPPSPLTPTFAAGAGLLLSGMLLYNSPQLAQMFQAQQAGVEPVVAFEA